VTRNVESVLRHFADASYAYRFGPPQHDAVVVSLERGDELLSQAFRFPTGRPIAQEDLGLEADRDGDRLVVRSRKLAYGVRIHGAAATSDNAFSIEPGRERIVTAPGASALTALNLSGQVRLAT
jgi:beta-mannosidase